MKYTPLLILRGETLLDLSSFLFDLKYLLKSTLVYPEGYAKMSFPKALANIACSNRLVF